MVGKVSEKRTRPNRNEPCVIIDFSNGRFFAIRANRPEDMVRFATEFDLTCHEKWVHTFEGSTPPSTEMVAWSHPGRAKAPWHRLLNCARSGFFAAFYSKIVKNES